ncbi:MAG: tRNA preQ1(34) S-adenosylmethionine ribosyltransferase-isomerase QueA [Proteobacteria bacterium]|nr:tRNA preQ1(34) S-adenosylmethionine ribosyltransferase-isomerase QueA [Pseudomonadota bacterium]
MRVSDFDFDLPADLIAQQPMEPRDASRMLVVAETLVDRQGSELPDHLEPGDVIVFNDTKVIPARLRGKRGEGKIEVTLHRQDGPGLWRAFARPARRLHPGQVIVFADDFQASVEAKGEGGEVTLRFDCEDGDFFQALDKHGIMPLPPYIKRGDAQVPSDREDYQTLFAEREGAVAAPTAGLHFTPALVEALAARGVIAVRITLHVGAGTFLPVKVDDTSDHVMHAEYGEISDAVAERINRAKAEGGRVLAVGSTSMRILENAADEDGTLRPFAGETDIFITPGYQFRICDLMLTNFHLPRSTLFMLVSAFAGLDRMQTAYAHAIGQAYRFYSYGDCCLLQKKVEM